MINKLYFWGKGVDRLNPEMQVKIMRRLMLGFLGFIGALLMIGGILAIVK